MALFITFEGGDGSGKSTQAKMLYGCLLEEGFEVTLTHEPGGTEEGSHLRELLLRPPEEFNFTESAQLLLFCASRAQLVEKVIQPALKNPNGVVICDRYADSTIAYQVFGGRMKQRLPQVLAILEFATRGIKPDLTFYLDVDIEVGLARTFGRLKSPDSPHQFINGRQLSYLDFNDFDAKYLNEKRKFQTRVRKGYNWLIEHESGRWCRVDANSSPENVFRLIREKVDSLIRERNVIPQKSASRTNIAVK